LNFAAAAAAADASSHPPTQKVIRFSGVALGEACTIVLRGATQHLLDEAERSLHDALCVLSQVSCSLPSSTTLHLSCPYYKKPAHPRHTQQTVKETRTVMGAGCSEMLMAEAVDQLAASTRHPPPVLCVCVRIGSKVLV
jgi:T-complex protein 1 subunit beta